MTDSNEIFRERIERVKRMRANPSIVPALRAYYKDHPIQFIDDWGMTYDPRNVGTDKPAFMPFILFPRQRELIEWVLEMMRDETPGICEKSRDVGASWVLMALACTLCIFNPGFKAGFGSRKEEYVDKNGDPKSLFHKGRMFVQNLPIEFRAGYSVASSPYMRIGFPESESVITGEAGDNIGRGDRAKLYCVDEAAHVEHPDLIDASLSATTNCRIDLSSVNGRGNPFAEKRFSYPDKQVFTFHWRDDPRKDQAWYDKQCENLPAVVVAQEVDLDYSASVEGVIIPSAWVQAAIGVHLKLGIKPTGIHKAGLDVADQGGDKCAMAGRYGILLEHLDEWSGKSSDLFETSVRAVNLADDWGYESFWYDADGLGAGVRGDSRKINETREAENKRKILAHPHNGSGAVTDPTHEMEPGKKNQDFFRNLKAQSWWALRKRFHKTFLALQGQDFDPDELISIDPELPKLQSLTMELSQATYKLNETGKVLVNKTPDGARSPNLADAVVIAYAPHVMPMKINPGALTNAMKAIRR